MHYPNPNNQNQQFYPPQYPQGHMPQHHMAVTYSKKDTAHLAHLIATVCTAGIWGLLVWLPLTIMRTRKRKTGVTYYR